MDETPSPLIAFHAGTGVDDRGRTIEAIWGWDRDRLERTHDYIQWLFPTLRQSGANPGAPILSHADVAAFRASPELRERLRRSLDVMLRFYGLRLATGSDGPVVDETAAIATIGPRWWSAWNHNHLRLTRILDSVSTLGLEAEARALLECLLDLRLRWATGIDDTTVAYWSRAVRSGR